VASPCRLVQDGQELVYGPNVVADRIAVELALLNATQQFLQPYGISNRYTNFTTHPSQTPGRDLSQKCRPNDTKYTFKSM